MKPIWPKVSTMNRPRCHVTIHSQNWEVTGGGVGKWASSSPMLEKKRPVRLLPLMTGTLDGPIHPMRPKPITLRSLRSQSRGNVMQVILPFLSRFLVISGFLADTRPPRTKLVEKAGRLARAAPARPETAEEAAAMIFCRSVPLQLLWPGGPFVAALQGGSPLVFVVRRHGADRDARWRGQERTG